MADTTNTKSEERISYTKSGIIQNSDRKIVGGYVEGFVQSVRIRTAQTRNGPRTVADVRMNVVFSDKRVNLIAGDETAAGKLIDPKYHSTSCRVSFWGKAAENLQQHPPQKRQKMICAFTGAGKLNEFQNKDGKTVYSLEFMGTDFPQTNSRRRDDGESALITDGAAAPAASSAAAPAAASLMESFSEIDFADDEELPF